MTRTLLAFGELDPRPRAALAVLLALLLARVAGQEAAALQHRAQRRVGLLEGARDAVAQRAGLAGDAAAPEQRVHVEGGGHVGGLERLARRGLERLAREVLLEAAPVHQDLAAPEPEAHPCDGGLALAGGGGHRGGGPGFSQGGSPPAAARRADARAPRRP